MRFREILIACSIAVFGCSGPSTGPAPKVGAVAEMPQELADAAGMPLYPGASLPEGASNVRSQGSETRYEIVMKTKDDASKVEAFYKSRIKVSKIPDTNSLMGTSQSGAMVKVDIERKDGVTTIDAVSIVESGIPKAGQAPGFRK